MGLLTDLDAAASRVLERLGRERWLRAPPSFLSSLSPEPPRAILEVGAFEGGFSELALRTFPESRAWAIEPLPSAFSALQRRALQYPGRLHPLQLAVGERNGTVTLYEQTDAARASSLRPTTPAGRTRLGATGQRLIEVRLQTLDDLWRELAPSTPLIVDMSVQGYEREVIRGGRECLSEAAACLLFLPLDSLFEGQAGFAEVAWELDTLGLRYAGNLEQRHGVGGGAYASWCAFSRTKGRRTK